MLNCLKTIIETDRLLLVPISLDFVKDIFREFTAEITVFMTPKPPEKIEETREFIKSALEKMKKNEELQMVVLKPVDRDNIPSRKIPESLGGIVEKEYDKKNLSGIILHEVEYHIYKRE